MKIPLAIFCALLISSCATQPKISSDGESGRPDFSVLPPGAELYLWADTARAGPLIEELSFNGLSGKDASAILERTNEAWAAFYPEAAPARFFFAGAGNYPKLRAGFSMALSRDWKKVKSQTGNRYWFSKSYKLGVALGARLAFASDGDPFASPAFNDPAPQGFDEFRLPCVMALWLNEPGVKLDRFMEGLGIPLRIPAEDFFIGIIREAENLSAPSPEELWKPVFMIRTPSESQARALLNLLALARMFASSLEEGPAALAGELLAGAPVQNGRDLTISAEPMSAGEIALLLETFSVYSNGLVSD